MVSYSWVNGVEIVFWPTVKPTLWMNELTLFCNDKLRRYDSRSIWAHSRPLEGCGRLMLSGEINLSSSLSFWVLSRGLKDSRFKGSRLNNAKWRDRLELAHVFWVIFKGLVCSNLRWSRSNGTKKIYAIQNILVHSLSSTRHVRSKWLSEKTYIRLCLCLFLCIFKKTTNKILVRIVFFNRFMVLDRTLWWKLIHVADPT